MQKSDGADNPQEILTTEDLAWLGGFIDGDGCISLTRRKRKGGTNHYTPYIVISNSCEWIMEECSRILKLAEIGHWVTWRTKKYKGFNKRPMGAITINGLKRSNKFLEVLQPYIRGKHDQAECLKDFIDRRLEIGQYAKNSYDSVDDDYYERMKALKVWRSSETIRGKPESHRVKI